MALKTRFKQTQFAQNMKRRFQAIGLLPKNKSATTKVTKKYSKPQQRPVTEKTYKQKGMSVGEFIRYSSRKLQGKRTYAKKQR